MKWISAEDRLPERQYMNVFVRYGRREMGFGEKNYILDLVENGYIDVKWLDESPTKPPTNNIQLANNHAAAIQNTK